MIFQVTFPERMEYVQANSQTHLLQKYAEWYDDAGDIKDIEYVTDEEAKIIMLKNNDYDSTDPQDSETISLFDAQTGNEFEIIGSTEYI